VLTAAVDVFTVDVLGIAAPDVAVFAGDVAVFQAGKLHASLDFRTETHLCQLNIEEMTLSMCLESIEMFDGRPLVMQLREKMNRLRFVVALRFD